MSNDDLPGVYRALLAPGRTPYNYQMDVGEKILDGENLVIPAPTGCGKTLAVLAPFAVGWQRRRWRRLIYALPLRTLVNSIHAEAERCVKPLGLRVTMQTGEQPGDPFFDDGDVVVTTYDQVLSGLLGSPYGLGPKLNNINAAAIAGSLVVFDEFHLMEIGRAFLTAVAGLDLFRHLCQGVWMTATATSPVVDLIGATLSARVCGPSPTEIAALDCVARVRRTLAVEEEPLTADAVLRAHKSQTLVVTNRVGWAQQLCRDLTAKPGPPVLLLHSRFFREDRASRETDIREALGRDSSWSGIVLSTQAIEAGVDITCDQLHTVLCPMNALVQRAGRSARFPPEGDGIAEAQVHVYPLPSQKINGARCDGTAADAPPQDPVKERNPHLPYDAAELDRTWAVLNANQGAHLDPMTLAGWVETVHRERDAKETSLGVTARREQCLEKISRNCIQKQYDNVSDLIRSVDGVRCVIAAVPPRVPFAVDGLPLRLYQIENLIRGLNGSVGVWGWRVGEEQSAWEPITDPAAVKGCFSFCLSPIAARYTSEIGLELNERGERESPPISPPSRPGYDGGLKGELWVDHSRGVAACVDRRTDSDLADGSLLSEGLCRIYSASSAAFVAAAQSAGLCHDIGKLQDPWQRWAGVYQALKQPGYRHLRALAHTSFDSRSRLDCEFSKQADESVGRRGEHARASAVVSLAAVSSMIPAEGAARNTITVAAAAAILSHHGGWLGKRGADEQPLRFWDGWETEVREILGEVASTEFFNTVRKLVRQEPTRLLERCLRPVLGPDGLGMNWPVFAYLVRTLRLSDQKATADGSEGA